MAADPLGIGDTGSSQPQASAASDTSHSSGLGVKATTVQPLKNSSAAKKADSDKIPADSLFDDGDEGILNTRSIASAGLFSSKPESASKKAGSSGPKNKSSGGLFSSEDEDDDGLFSTSLGTTKNQSGASIFGDRAPKAKSKSPSGLFSEDDDEGSTGIEKTSGVKGGRKENLLIKSSGGLFSDEHEDGTQAIPSPNPATNSAGKDSSGGLFSDEDDDGDDDFKPGLSQGNSKVNNAGVVPSPKDSSAGTEAKKLPAGLFDEDDDFEEKPPSDLFDTIKSATTLHSQY